MTAPPGPAAEVNFAGGHSIMADMDSIEGEIKAYYHRLENLEKALKFRPMTIEEREQAEKDVVDMKNILKTQEKSLQALRRENRGSAMIAVILIFAAFLFFGIYHMCVTSTKSQFYDFSEG